MKTVPSWWKNKDTDQVEKERNSYNSSKLIFDRCKSKDNAIDQRQFFSQMVLE